MKNNYTASQIIIELEKLLPILKKKTKTRFYIDQRNYLISILYYKFNFTEAYISDILDMERSSINYAKKRVILSLEKENDWTFEVNTLHLSQKFPFKFPTEFKKDKLHQYKALFLNLESLNKIELFKNRFGIESTDKAIKILITLGLDNSKHIVKPIEIEFDLK
jgi:hypothetical protein